MNKINYDLKLKETLSTLEKSHTTPTLLLHSCCAPCSSAVLSVLCKHFDITIFFYNPNITDSVEYERRLNEQTRFIELINSGNTEFVPLFPIKIVTVPYTSAEWSKKIAGYENLKEGSIRCFACYELRIEATANLAKEKGFKYFCTTLSVSPYKNSAWINEIGAKFETENTKFLFADFKKNNGYQKSVEYSAKYNLYRQNYCGCILSQKERDERHLLNGNG